MSQQFSAWIPGGAAVGHLLEIAASLAVITLLFAMIFKVLPDVKIGWNDVWIGAFVTAILFTIGKFAIGMYIGKSGIASAYGAAGSIVVLITWIYYSAQILYFGAEFTQVYATRFGSQIVPESNAEPLTPQNRAAQGLKEKQVTPVAATGAAPANVQRESHATAHVSPQPLWKYVVIAVTWLGTALLFSRGNKGSSRRRAA
jgi:hypothetical protein